MEEEKRLSVEMYGSIESICESIIEDAKEIKEGAKRKVYVEDMEPMLHSIIEKCADMRDIFGGKRVLFFKSASPQKLSSKAYHTTQLICDDIVKHAAELKQRAIHREPVKKLEIPLEAIERDCTYIKDIFAGKEVSFEETSHAEKSIEINPKSNADPPKEEVKKETLEERVLRELRTKYRFSRPEAGKVRIAIENYLQQHNKEYVKAILKPVRDGKFIAEDLISMIERTYWEPSPKKEERAELKPNERRDIERLEAFGVKIKKPLIITEIGNTTTIVGEIDSERLNFAVGDVSRGDFPRFTTIKFKDRVLWVKKSDAVERLKEKWKKEEEKKAKQLKLRPEKRLETFEKKPEKELSLEEKLELAWLEGKI